MGHLIKIFCPVNGTLKKFFMCPIFGTPTGVMCVIIVSSRERERKRGIQNVQVRHDY